MSELKVYSVWDAPTRYFHWINALCVIGLIGVGTVILYAGDLGVSNQGKIDLKTLHTWIGYVFAVNLFIRLLWAFIGNRHARWRAFLPGGKGYLNGVSRYIQSFTASRPIAYLGHNPIGRLSVTLLLLLLSIQAITGLVLAGTDLFFPPFGHWIAQWVAAPGVDPTTLVAYAPDTYDATEYDAMRAFRKPFITVHVYNFYVLIVTATIHVLAVVFTELREGNGIISAMFSGQKVLKEKPVDES